MHFSLFKEHGAKNSADVFDAFARGLARHGQKVSYHQDLADVAVIWSVLWKGRMQANQGVYQRFRDSQRPVVVLEVGAIQRGTTWRVGLNGIGLCSRLYDPGQRYDRARAQGLELDTCTPRRGSDIMIALQQSTSLQWAGMPPVDVWVRNLVASIREHSDRPIVIRPHPREPVAFDLPNVHWQQPSRLPNTYDDFDLDQQIKNAWCVINWSSNAAISAAIKSVPVITGPDSLAAPVGQSSLDNIEGLCFPDHQRSQWLCDLAYHEWTLAELNQGLMIPALLSRLQSV